MSAGIQRVVLALAAVALLGMPLVAQSEPNTKRNFEVSEALELAEEAVEYGKHGDTGAMAKQADRALQHALNAAMENRHLDAAIDELKITLEHAEAGHADLATKHAEAAMAHLSAVQ